LRLRYLETRKTKYKLTLTKYGSPLRHSQPKSGDLLKRALHLQKSIEVYGSSGGNFFMKPQAKRTTAYRSCQLEKEGSVGKLPKIEETQRRKKYYLEINKRKLGMQ
jgi:hypothetical protein